MSTMSTAPAALDPTLRKIDFDFPLDRPGAEPLAGVTVRKPGSGELRGLSLMALSQLDYATLEALLPRITIPQLSKFDVAKLDPADFMQLAGEVMDFLLPKAAKQEVSPEA
jgi:hypothetical protein